MESESANCRLFTTALERDAVPRRLVVAQKMRKHLHNCLQQRGLSAFPTAKQRRTALHAKLTAADSSHVYCVCRMSEHPNATSKCNYCGVLYNTECISVLPCDSSPGGTTFTKGRH